MISKHQGERGSFPKSFLFCCFQAFCCERGDFGTGQSWFYAAREGDGPDCAQGMEPQGWDMGAAKLLWCLFVQKSKENCVQSHQLDPITLQQDTGISGAPL